jgi:hypothetical protein
MVIQNHLLDVLMVMVMEEENVLMFCQLVFWIAVAAQKLDVYSWAKFSTTFLLTTPNQGVVWIRSPRCLNSFLI